MTVKNLRVKYNFATGPAFVDSTSPTGWSANKYNIAIEAEHAEWYAEWEAYLTAHPEKRAGDAPMEAREGKDVRNNNKPSGEGNGRAPQPRLAEVKEWLSAYEGNFSFLRDMKAIATGKSKWDRFTEGQYTALVKMLDKEIAFKAEKAAAQNDNIVERNIDDSGIRFDNFPYGTFRFAVENNSGELTFIRIDHVAENDKFGNKSRWFNWTFVKQEIGPEESKLGAARPGQAYIGTFNNLIEKILANPTEAMIRYGKEIGTCGDCGRRLTNAASREMGIGPVCAAKEIF